MATNNKFPKKTKRRRRQDEEQARVRASSYDERVDRAFYERHLDELGHSLIGKSRQSLLQ